jgi:hypothetical protein
MLVPPNKTKLTGPPPQEVTRNKGPYRWVQLNAWLGGREAKWTAKVSSDARAYCA